jgi:hypothetical protein
LVSVGTIQTEKSAIKGAPFAAPFRYLPGPTRKESDICTTIADTSTKAVELSETQFEEREALWKDAKRKIALASRALEAITSLTRVASSTLKNELDK